MLSSGPSKEQKEAALAIIKNKKWNYINLFLTFVIIALTITNIFITINNTNQSKNQELYCDLVNSVFAEREYTYPILRELGYEPTNYGKDIKNPITTKQIYSQDCK